jgi:hypothetical protein
MREGSHSSGGLPRPDGSAPFKRPGTPDLGQASLVLSLVGGLLAGQTSPQAHPLKGGLWVLDSLLGQDGKPRAEGAGT